MFPRARRVTLCLAVIGTGVATSFAQPSLEGNRLETSALADYIKKPDPAYVYHERGRKRWEGGTDILVDLTSQQWRTATEVDRPAWTHHLLVSVPDDVKGGTAMLVVGGYSNTDAPPTEADADWRKLAKDTHTIVAELRYVPNQPLTFSDAKGPLSENDIQNYGRRKFMLTGDTSWLVSLPTTKSAVRAMDALQELAAKGVFGVQTRVRDFVVSGRSKRGMTTWLVGSHDSRVVAIIPIVANFLNLPEFLRMQKEWLGAEVTADFRVEAMKPEARPRAAEVLRIEDPFIYRARLTMPKLIINATGDRMQPPVSSQQYFAGLPGEKHLRFVANAPHSHEGSDWLETLRAFYADILAGKARPNLEWKNPAPGVIEATTDQPVVEVLLWQATNPQGRDFRFEKVGKIWHSEIVRAATGKIFTAHVAAPAKGSTAYYLEFVYPPGTTGDRLKLTTHVYTVDAPAAGP